MLHDLHYALDLQKAPPATWERLAPMPTSRHGLGVTAHAERLYAAGGCLEDPQRDVRALEVFGA